MSPMHSIMIVDDNTDMLHVYERILKLEGYEVFTASSGKECLEQLESICPEIFLMDVVLPDWNGIDLVKELKGRPEFSSSIFVLLSGFATDSDSKIKGLDAGALDYLARPIPNKELVAKVKSLIKIMDFQETLIVLSKELELRVAERTLELEKTIETLQSEIEQRKLLEGQFQQAQKMEAVGMLAGGIAHDFNNILTVISGNAFLRNQKDAKRGELSPEINQILEATELAARLTQGLLAFSRKQDMDMNPVKLNDLILHSISLGRRIVQESVAITAELWPEELTVMADAGLIQQAIFNLISNARDAMSAAGTITIRTSHVEITPSTLPTGFLIPAEPKTGLYAVISVIDSGAGISLKNMRRIFDPFFTTKEKGKGTGLGLAMIQGTIMQHDGLIAVDSCDTGTTFSIYLPLLENQIFPEIVDDSPQTASETQANQTIMVAEDDENVRELLDAALSNAGYRVIAVENGRMLVDIFKETKDPVSLIILDVVMPVMSGQEAAEQIRRLNPDIPCMFMTGYGADILNRHDVGIHENIIRKPFNIPDMLNKVRSLIESR